MTSFEDRCAGTALVDWNNYQTLGGLFDDYLVAHATWGSLHIALEDGNCDRPSVEFCLKFAVEHKDWLGAYLATVLLALRDVEIAKLRTYRDGMTSFFMEVLMDRADPKT